MTTQDTQTAIAEIWQMFKETDARLDKRFAETDARLDKLFAETQKEIKETQKEIKETQKQIRQLDGTFRTHWGKMIEAMVEPNALRLFQERGLAVKYSTTRAKMQHNGDTMEADVILDNGDVTVVVEVKSSLSVDDVNDFLKMLQKFTTFFTRYKDTNLYGAVAALTFDKGVDRYAYKRGLYVVAFTGEEVTAIKNAPTFKARNFALQPVA